VDVRFELLWRREGRDDVELASWSHRFEPLGGGNFDAQPLELTADGPAVDQQPGDQLVLRYSADNGEVPMAYIPNGEGERANGRIPYVDLPQ
jgi:hypothetical protein